MTRTLPLILTAAIALAAAPSALAAETPQPPLDITKLPYQPIGFFKPGEPIPDNAGTMCDEVLKPQMKNGIFNPSGTNNAFDNDVFQGICLPFRNQDDQSANDPWGNGGEARHGYCAGANPANPDDPGTCPNHQLEYIDYYKKTMMDILKDFHPSYHEYDFENVDGQGRNPAIVIPGADHPDEHILIGSHYDQTLTGPASVWDSAEGHSEMIRVARLMADYWHATGTRPSATVKFMPMDGEEDGTNGSQDYVNNTIVPGEEAKVRGYWNADPCAGGYPAYQYGARPHRIPINVQIGDPPSEESAGRINAFNEKVPGLIEQVFDQLDDTYDTYPDKPQLYVSTSEATAGVGADIGTYVVVSNEHPFLFSSDWANFIAAGVPIFNPTPKVTGPAISGDPSILTPQGNPDALYAFHTPLDNLQQVNHYAGAIVRNTWSEGWMKGMEMCSHMLAWGMLQPYQGGAQTVNNDPIAYYEALPNEAEKGKLVNFDGTGSYQYADASKHAFVDPAQLQWKWNFGDGVTAYGQSVKHVYRSAAVFKSTLTVTNRATGKSATMTVPITVEDGSGKDSDPAGQDKDSLPSGGNVVACKSSSGFTSAGVTPAGKGLKVTFLQNGNQPTKVTIYRASDGRHAKAPKKVKTFTKTGGFTWNGKGAKRGDYYVTLEHVQPDGQIDRRAFAFTRSGSKFKKAKPFFRPDSCNLISLFRLAAPAFGGKRALDIAFASSQTGSATVTVSRGKKKVKTFKVKLATPNRAQRLRLPAKKLRKGVYVVKLTVKSGSASRTEKLYARKL